MFEWVYKATIYRQMDGKVLLEKHFKTEEGAECCIEQNIKEFVNDDYPPTGHVCKDYIKVD